MPRPIASPMFPDDPTTNVTLTLPAPLAVRLKLLAKKVSPAGGRPRLSKVAAKLLADRIDQLDRGVTDEAIDRAAGRRKRSR